jgi:hypothetical protein
MRPEFRVIFTVLLGKPCLWAQSKAGIRSVGPFFMIAVAASELELWTVLRQIGRHTGPQTRPDAQKPLESAHALICSVLPPASNCLLTAHSRPQAANLQHRAVHRRRTNWRALSPAFAQEGDLFTIQTSTRRKRALNAWGFNACGALGNKHCRKNTGKLRPDQIKGAIARNYRIANRWWAYRADNRRRCGSRAPH